MLNRVFGNLISIEKTAFFQFSYFFYPQVFVRHRSLKDGMLNDEVKDLSKLNGKKLSRRHIPPFPGRNS